MVEAGMVVTYNSTNNMKMVGKDQFFTAPSKNSIRTFEIKTVRCS